MLMLESRRQGWSAGRPQASLPLHRNALNAAKGTLLATTNARLYQKPEISHEGTKNEASCRLPFKGTLEKRLPLMHTPPFLQSLVVRSRESVSPAAAKARKGTLTQEAEGGGNLRLPPSASLTATTATAEVSTTAAEVKRRDPADRERNSSPITTATSQTSSSTLPFRSGSSEEEVKSSFSQAISAAASEKGDNLSVSITGPTAAAAAEHISMVMQRQHPITEPARLVIPYATQMGISDAGKRKEDTADSYSSPPHDSSVARLAAALAASSLRLAAAVEEGIEISSPNSGGRPWMLQRRPETPTPGVPKAEPFLKNSLSACLITTPRKPGHSGGPADHRSPLISRVPASCKGTRGPRASLEAPPHEEIPQSPFQAPSHRCPQTRIYKRRECSARTGQNTTGGSRTKPAEAESTPLGPSPARSSTGWRGAVLFPRKDTRSYCNGISDGFPGQTNTSYSETIESKQKECPCTPPMTAATPPAGVPQTPLTSQHLCSDFGGPRRSPQNTASHILQQQHGGLVKQKRIISGISAVEEEQQFSLLLEHSMVLLQREAARCFASSQASVKQKLWGELQQERLLRLQQQQHHQSAAAAADAELASLRARKIEDHTRTERLLGICCNRKKTDEALRLVVLAWRAWRQQRLFTRRCRQLQKLLQKRQRLLLVLRIFYPWRATTTRLVAAQQQQRAQRFLQQEMQRLEQVHLEVRQQHQQQLLQLQQKLTSEMRLRECLQQCLIGIVTGGLNNTPARGVSPQPSSSTKMSVAIPSSPGILKGKQYKHQQKLQQRLERQRKSLAIVGVHSNLTGQRAPPLPQQRHQQRQLHQEEAVLQQAPVGQLRLQHTKQRALSIPVNEAYSTSSGAFKGSICALGRRVKFMDEEEAQEQRQQQLLLLTSLLATCPLRQVQDKIQMPGSPGARSMCWPPGRNSSVLLSSASAPAVACWGLLNKGDGVASAPAMAAPAVSAQATNASNLPESHDSHDSLLSQMGPIDGGITQGAAVDPPLGSHVGNPLGLNAQPLKSRRWTAAAQPSPPA